MYIGAVCVRAACNYVPEALPADHLTSWIFNYKRTRKQRNDGRAYLDRDNFQVIAARIIINIESVRRISHLYTSCHSLIISCRQFSMHRISLLSFLVFHFSYFSKPTNFLYLLSIVYYLFMLNSHQFESYLILSTLYDNIRIDNIWYFINTLRHVKWSIVLILAYGNLGSILSEQGRVAEAEEAFVQALRYRPNMADVHYNL